MPPRARRRRQVLATLASLGALAGSLDACDAIIGTEDRFVARDGASEQGDASVQVSGDSDVSAPSTGDGDDEGEGGGGSSVFDNYGFENAGIACGDDWLYGNGTISASSDAHSGARACQVCGNSAVDLYITEGIPLEAGISSIYVAVWAKVVSVPAPTVAPPDAGVGDAGDASPDGGDAGAPHDAGEAEESDAEVSVYPTMAISIALEDGGSNFSHLTQAAQTLDQGWVQLSIAHGPVAGETAIYVSLGNGLPGGQCILWDDLQVVQQ